MKMNNNKYRRESFLPCLESDLNGEYEIGRGEDKKGLF